VKEKIIVKEIKKKNMRNKENIYKNLRDLVYDLRSYHNGKRGRDEKTSAKNHPYFLKEFTEEKKTKEKSEVLSLLFLGPACYNDLVMRFIKFDHHFFLLKSLIPYGYQIS
jgi:hypothetical protein